MISIRYCCLLLLSFIAFQTSAAETPRLWAERVADATMQAHPEAWSMRKSDGDYRWAYTQGLVLLGFQRLANLEGDERYAAYAKAYVDHYVDADGNIATLELDHFNIDSINSGKLLFMLDEQAGDDRRYQSALTQLRHQLEWHPRTSEGVFWHKLKYPWQVWLDGLYMAAPFYAQYDQQYNQSKNTDDILQQFRVSYKQLLDANTGLLFHGWDESRIQAWANPETGRSPGFWSRALGWYAMALVDTYEYLEDPKAQKELQAFIVPLFNAIARYQDKSSGLWYQVIDQGSRQGNYLEASSSAMFIYSFAKAHRLGLLNDDFRNKADQAWLGMKTHLIEFDPKSGHVILKNVCRSAGLGGHPYRDGSYHYYVNETDRVENDAHGVGALLLALVELATPASR